MKLKINIPNRRFTLPVCLVSCLFLLQATLNAQDSTVVAEETTTPAKVKTGKKYFSKCLDY